MEKKRNKRIDRRTVRRNYEKAINRQTKRTQPQGAVQTCCICGEVFMGHGHNAAPVEEGVCCDDCNWNVVLKERMRTRRTIINF